jgi:hypothetical protein
MNKQYILIATHPVNAYFFESLIKSFKGYDKYPIYVVVNGKPTYFTTEMYDFYDNLKEDLGFKIHFTNKSSYELGAIKHMATLNYVDEFFLLQDTVIIKDFSIFDYFFETKRNISISMGTNYGMYIGKYLNKYLRTLELPDISTKREAVKYESKFPLMYITVANESGYETFDSGFRDTYIFDNINNMNCMILENQYLKKLKRTYNADLIKDDE